MSLARINLLSRAISTSFIRDPCVIMARATHKSLMTYSSRSIITLSPPKVINNDKAVLARHGSRHDKAIEFSMKLEGVNDSSRHIELRR